MTSVRARALMAVVGALLLGLAALRLLQPRGGGQPGDRAGSPSAVAARPDPGRRVLDALDLRSRSLLFLEGRVLKAIDLVSGVTQRAGRLRADAAFASPDGEWIAEVVPLEGGVDGQRDFVLEPELRLLRPSTGVETAVGAGFAPLWRPDGRAVAFLRPLSPRLCSGEICKGDVEVVALDTKTMSEAVLLGPGRWGLLSWLGQSLLVSDLRDLTRVVAASPAGRRDLPLAPSEVWGGSPDGDWLVTVRRGRVEIEPGREGAPSGGATIALGSGILAEGAWAPNSRAVAAVQLGGGARLVVFGPGRPRPAPMAGLAAAGGPVLWSPDSSLVLATGSAAGGRAVVACAVDPPGECERVLDYRPAITPLAVTG